MVSHPIPGRRHQHSTGLDTNLDSHNVNEWRFQFLASDFAGGGSGLCYVCAADLDALADALGHADSNCEPNANAYKDGDGDSDAHAIENTIPYGTSAGDISVKGLR